MGKTIEQIATQRGHQISHIIDVNNAQDLQTIRKGDTDVVIEFTQPESAFENVKYCIENQIPIVCGTTGWLDKRLIIEQICQEKKSAFFYASNYSIGVNIFFKINQILAKMMNPYSQYEVSIEEIHHIEKKDAPSGTAITLAEDIIENLERKKGWKLAKNITDQINITAIRETDVAGTHTVFYKSDIDTIQIKHIAHSRQGFALGAVLAAEWLKDKQGVFGMNDLLGF
ncbi:MAG: 4-hydroxy-tetrahydrodipicolinate reductase [Thermoflexibacter sp.]